MIQDETKRQEGRYIRNSTIDVIKGIFVLLIVVTHFSLIPEQYRLSPLFTYFIDLAVPVFMFISGYVFSGMYERHNVRSLVDAYSAKTWLRSAIRYTIPFLTIALVEVISPRVQVSDDGAPLAVVRWLINGTVGYGSYYYPIMMQFLFVFPLVYFIIQRAKSQEGGVLLCLLINGIYELLVWSYGIPVESYRLIVCRYIFVIAVGCYTFCGKQRPKIWWGILLILFGAVLIFAYRYLNYSPIVLSKMTAVCFVASMFILPFCYLGITHIKISCPPIELIGKASYHVFLVQMLYYSGYAGLVINHFSSWQIKLLASVITCTVIAVLFYFVDTSVCRLIYEKCLSLLEVKTKDK